MASDYPNKCERYCYLRLNRMYMKKYLNTDYVEQCIRMPRNDDEKKQFNEIINKIYEYNKS